MEAGDDIGEAMEGGANGGPIEAVDNLVYLSVMIDAG
jgi:hypothetical protein